MKSGREHEHEHEHSHDHGHLHPRRREVLNRLSRAIGHLEGVKRMVEDDANCSDVLIQLSAVRSALNNTGRIILDDHMQHCLRRAVVENNLTELEKLSDAIAKFLK